MNLQNLAIATISWARDKAEEDLLLRSLKQLSLLDIPVFITDAGSPEAFLKKISRLNRFHVFTSTQKGLWPQVNTSLQQASNSGASFIFYTEPDKHSFFYLLPELLSTIEVNEKTGVVLVARDAAAMASFPPFQQMTETTINNCCAELTGLQLDYTYGPFLLHKDVVPNLQALPADVGWGWRPYAFSIAARAGLAITAISGDYPCPEDQQKDNATERIYRMKQLIENIRALVLSVELPAITVVK